MDDVIVLVSSSGTSKNIVNAAVVAKEMNINVVSLTGPNPSTKLNKHPILKVPSRLYNIIECLHMVCLCSVVDEINPVKLS